MSNAHRALAVLCLGRHEKTSINEGINKRPRSGQLGRVGCGYTIRVEEKIIVKRCSADGHVSTARNGEELTKNRVQGGGLTILRQESKAFICLMGNNPLQAIERLIVRPSQDPISPLRLADVEFLEGKLQQRQNVRVLGGRIAKSLVQRLAGLWLYVKT